MATEFKLPELGENIEEAQVVSVLKGEGDSVEAEEAIIEVETEKAVMEVPAPSAGTIASMKVGEGDTIKVGDVVCTIEAGAGGGAAAQEKAEAPEAAESEEAGEAEEAEAAADEKRAEARVEAGSGAWEGGESVGKAGGQPEQAPAEPGAEAKPEEAETPAPSGERIPVFASPSVRRFAREIGVDITSVEGTGPGGRISEADVKRYARTTGGNGAVTTGRVAAPPLPNFEAEGPVERKAMSMIAKKTAQQMALCWSLIPHVTLHDDIDSTDLEAFRQNSRKQYEKEGGKLTPTALLIKAVVAALQRFPSLNSSLDAPKQEIVYKRYYHIGVAADTPRGLVVPVIRHADRKGLGEIAAELTEMADRARSGKLAIEEMQGATFSITNLGGIGCGYFTPIVNHPEVAILGVGTAKNQPVERDGQFVSRLMMPVSLSFDHRVVNGADGARFLRWLKNAIENPLTALMD